MKHINGFPPVLTIETDQVEKVICHTGLTDWLKINGVVGIPVAFILAIILRKLYSLQDKFENKNIKNDKEQP